MSDPLPPTFVGKDLIPLMDFQKMIENYVEACTAKVVQSISVEMIEQATKEAIDKIVRKAVREEIEFQNRMGWDS